MTAERFNAVPGMHLVTTQLIDLLKDGPIGRAFTDEELTRMTERDCRPGGNGYGYLQSATGFVLRNHGYVWKRIAGGDQIKCLNPEEVESLSVSDRKAIYRRGVRSCRRVRAVFVAADEKTRKGLTQQLAIHGALSTLASTKTQKKLEARNPLAIPDARKLLEAIVESDGET